jgi:hypothetical protein
VTFLSIRRTTTINGFFVPLPFKSYRLSYVCSCSFDPVLALGQTHSPSPNEAALTGSCLVCVRNLENGCDPAFSFLLAVACVTLLRNTDRSTRRMSDFRLNSLSPCMVVPPEPRTGSLLSPSLSTVGHFRVFKYIRNPLAACLRRGRSCSGAFENDTTTILQDMVFWPL